MSIHSQAANQNTLNEMTKFLNCFKEELNQANNDLFLSFEKAYMSLSLLNGITLQNKIEVSQKFLNPINNFTLLKKDIEKKLNEIIGSIYLVINNELLNQNSYYLILSILNNISNIYFYFQDDKKKIFLVNLLKIFQNLILEKYIQFSSKIVHLFFSLITKIIHHNSLNKNDVTKGFYTFLSDYSLLLFKFLSDFIRPLITKKNKNFSSKENLDDAPVNKRKQQSFYTITESQSENEKSQYDNLTASINVFQTIAFDNNDAIKLEIKEYQNVDLYNDCIYIFSYLFNVVLSTSSSTEHLKNVIEIITNIIIQTDNLFLYLDEYKNIICNDLAKQISIILIRFKDNHIEIELKEKISNLVFSIIKHLHRGYWLLPYLLCESKNNFYSNEKFIFYELYEKLTSDPFLLNEIYSLKYEKVNNNCNTSDKEIVENESVINLISVILSEKNLKIISLMKNSDDNFLSPRRKEKNHYLSIITKILYNFLNFINSELSFNHIYINPNIPNVIQDTLEHKKLKEKILYFSTYIPKVLNFVVTENILLKTPLSDLFDLSNNFCNIYSIFDLHNVNAQILGVWIYLIKNKEVEEGDFFYISKTFLSFINNLNINNSIESWITNFSFMQSIYIYLSMSKYNYTIIPKPQIEIEVYIKHIEHFIRMYSFNFYDTMLKNEKNELNSNNEYNEDCDFNISTCNTKSFVKNNFTNNLQNYNGNGNCSFHESPDTNNTNGLRISFMKNKQKVSYLLRKQSTSINSNNVCVNVIDKNSYITKSPDPTSFIEKESTNNYLVISNSIDSYFIENSVNYGNDYLLIIINALLKNTLDCIKEKKVLELQFNLIKIMEISSVNVYRINLFWTKLTLMIYEVFIFTQNITLLVFTLDTYFIISMFILFLFAEEEQETLDNNDAENWLNERYQTLIFNEMKKIISKIIEKKEEKLIEFVINNIWTLLFHLGGKINKNGSKAFYEMLVYFMDNIKNYNPCFCIIEEIVDNYPELYEKNNYPYLLHIIQLYLSSPNTTIEIKTKILDIIDKLSKYYGKPQFMNDYDGFYSEIKDILFCGVIDEDFSVRQHSIELLQKIFVDKKSSISQNKKYLNEENFEMILKKAYESYKKEICKRIANSIYNGNMNNASNSISCSELSFTNQDKNGYNSNVYVKIPSKRFSLKHPLQQEKELQQTFISLLSMVNQIKLINIDYLIPFYEEVIQLSSSEILSQIISTINNNLCNIDYNEKINNLMIQVFNIISSDCFLYNFWYNKDKNIIYNSISYLKTVINKSNFDITKLQSILIKLIKYIQDKDSNILSQEELFIYDFIRDLKNSNITYIKNILNFYLTTCMIKDYNKHSFVLAEHSIQQLYNSILEIINFNSLKNNIEEDVEINKLYDNFNSNLKYFEKDFDYYEKIAQNYFIAYFDIFALILRLSRKTAYYDKTTDIILYLYNNEKSYLINEVLVNFISIQLIKITNDLYSNYDSKLIQIIQNTFFNFSNKNYINEHLLLIFITNLFNESNICELSKKILLSYMQDELFKQYLKNDTKNEKSLRKKQISLIVTIVEKVNAYIHLPQIQEDQNFIQNIKSSIEAISIPNESIISEKASNLLSSI